MKRMIISGIVGIVDLFGYVDIVTDLQYFEKTGIYPTPNIGLELSQIIWLLLDSYWKCDAFEVFTV